MNLKIKILLGFLVVLLVIQFFRPQLNNKENKLSKSIEQEYQVPDSVLKLIQISCYDCHSNSSYYPWYFKIQPIAWWMSSHISEAKAQLNFSVFGSYSKLRQRSKLKGIARSVSDGSMPLPSYTFMHTKAKLNESQKALIKNWALNLRDSI